jgi:hypothetical protein
MEEHCPDLFLRMIRERRGRFARAQAVLKKKEAEASGLTPSGTPIEAMADGQAREAAEEAERKAKAERRRPKKPEGCTFSISHSNHRRGSRRSRSASCASRSRLARFAPIYVHRLVRLGFFGVYPIHHC